MDVLIDPLISPFPENTFAKDITNIMSDDGKAQNHHCSDKKTKK